MKVAQAPVHLRQILEILRLLYRGADVLILDEPTSVLAPQQVQDLLTLLRRLRAEGRTIIFISHKLGRSPGHRRPHHRAARRDVPWPIQRRARPTLRHWRN